MVCLGNICRSPLAEGLMAAKLPEDQFYVDSAGTGGWHVGQRPDSRSIAVAKKYGLDISKQRGRQFTASDFEEFDFIYAMDSSNFDNILTLARHDNDRSKVKMILNELYPETDTDVPDPYYGGDSGFDDVYNMLDKATAIIAQRLITK